MKSSDIAAIRQRWNFIKLESENSLFLSDTADEVLTLLDEIDRLNAVLQEISIATIQMKFSGEFHQQLIPARFWYDVDRAVERWKR